MISTANRTLTPLTLGYHKTKGQRTHKPKIHLRTKCALLLSVVCFQLYSQTNTLNNVLAQNFKAENLGLQITAPSNWQSQNIYIGWQNKQGQQYSEQILINPGTNIIIPKNGWSGQVNVLATNAQGLQSLLIPVTTSILLQSFLSPNLVTPGSINFDTGYSLGNYPFKYILIFVLLLSAALFFALKRNSFLLPFYIGLVSAFIVLDIRQIKNHFDVTSSIMESKYQITPFEELGQFYKDCEEVIGTNTWRLDQLPGVWNSYAKYSLAQKSMVPKRESKAIKHKFLLTSKPNVKGETLLLSRGIKLIELSQ